jgi:hypothetical protein
MISLKATLQKWLEIEKIDVEAETKRINAAVKKAELDVSSLTSNQDFWKRQFKKQQPPKKCTKCGEPIDLWPFNDVAYYIESSRVTHQSCQGEYKGGQDG